MIECNLCHIGVLNPGVVVVGLLFVVASGCLLLLLLLDLLLLLLVGRLVVGRLCNLGGGFAGGPDRRPPTLGPQTQLA